MFRPPGGLNWLQVVVAVTIMLTTTGIAIGILVLIAEASGWHSPRGGGPGPTVTPTIIT